jgi:hypothetical protein
MVWPNIFGTTEREREREREREIAGVGCGRLETVHLKCQLHFGEPLDTEIAERERRLAADNGIGRLTLSVQ